MAGAEAGRAQATDKAAREQAVALALKALKPTDAASAAKLKMFGSMTRTVEDWDPHRILCRRFNVAYPWDEKQPNLPAAAKGGSLFGSAEVWTPPTGSNTAGLRLPSSFGKGHNAAEAERLEATLEAEEEKVLQIKEKAPKPSRDLFKAIFEDDSSDDSSSEDEQALPSQPSQPSQQPPAASLLPLPPSTHNSSSSSSQPPFSGALFASLSPEDRQKLIASAGTAHMGFTAAPPVQPPAVSKRASRWGVGATASSISSSSTSLALTQTQANMHMHEQLLVQQQFQNRITSLTNSRAPVGLPRPSNSAPPAPQAAAISFLSKISSESPQQQSLTQAAGSAGFVHPSRLGQVPGSSTSLATGERDRRERNRDRDRDRDRNRNRDRDRDRRDRERTRDRSRERERPGQQKREAQRERPR